MKKISTVILPLFLMCSIPAIAQSRGVVYKCTDKNGDVTYASESSPGLTCDKTDISKKVMQISNVGGSGYAPSKGSSGNGSSSSSSAGSPSIPNISQEEQKKKDNNRVAILENELKDEQESVSKVDKMITNAGKDEAQVKQLQELKGRHLQNVQSLQREIKLQGGKS